MIVDITKQYRTQQGYAVDVLQVLDYPDSDGMQVVGVIHYDSGKTSISTWGPDGNYFSSGGESFMDLVEVPERKTGWINIYPFCCGGVYRSKEKADEAADEDRVACIRIEYEMGEGL